MTNKEAIEILKPLTGYNVDKNGIGTFPMVSTPLQAEALDLAIKALERGDRYDEGHLDGMSEAEQIFNTLRNWRNAYMDKGEEK